MNTDPDFDRHAAAWLADGPTELADRVLDAALREVHVTHQRRRLWVTPWRTPFMSTSLRSAAGIAIVAVVGIAVLSFVGRGSNIGVAPTPGPSASATPSPAPIGTVGPTVLGPIDTSAWTIYASNRYGFTIGHPADWTEHPADHTWTLATDAKPLALDTGADRFSSSGDTVRVTAWSVAVAPGATTDVWLQAYCPLASEPCTLLAANTVAVTVDGHAGSLVTFSEDVQAFVLVNNRMYVIAVWEPDSNPNTFAYGGAHRLLEGFLSTMHLGTSIPAPS